MNTIRLTLVQALASIINDGKMPHGSVKKEHTREADLRALVEQLARLDEEQIDALLEATGGPVATEGLAGRWSDAFRRMTPAVIASCNAETAPAVETGMAHAFGRFSLAHEVMHGAQNALASAQVKDPQSQAFGFVLNDKPSRNGCGFTVDCTVRPAAVRPGRKNIEGKVVAGEVVEVTVVNGALVERRVEKGKVLQGKLKALAVTSFEDWPTQMLAVIAQARSRMFD